MSTLIQRSFAAGEVAPELYSRVDTVKYQTGLRTSRNAWIMRHSGAQSRPGTLFVSEVKDSTKTGRLLPFIFNNAQSYALEFGEGYIRVYKNGVLVSEPTKNITGITQAAQCVVTIPGHGYVKYQAITISGVVGMTQVNNIGGTYYFVDPIDANTFYLKDATFAPVNSSGYSAYVSGGVATSGIFTPYSQTQLSAIRFAQSADVLKLAHGSHPECELKRYADGAWTFTVTAVGPTIASPTVTVSTASGDKAAWVVTSITTKGEESSPNYVGGVLYENPQYVTSNAVPSSGAPVTLSWSAVTGAVRYNIYRAVNGVFGFYGTTENTSFVDYGYGTPDTANPVRLTLFHNPFNDPGAGPTAVAYYQQRFIRANVPFSNTLNEALFDWVWASRVGWFSEFSTRSPIRDDDAVSFRLAGKLVAEVKHLMDLNRLLVFTSCGEWSINGDSAGILKPTDINARQHSSYGASDLPPLNVGGSALFVQARGSIVRDLAYEFQSDSYRGNELTIFSPHLIAGYTLVDWAYQQIPHSIVWAVRSDGVLLGMTYVREQQIVAWHRHDTDGVFENVCAIPEGSEDSAYFIVRRTINGVTKRYIERMPTRLVSNATIKDFVGMDCAKKYDGRNTGNTTMTLSGGTAWDYTETLTLTASAATFSVGNVGNKIQLTSSNGQVVRFLITGYTSSTVVTGSPDITVPSDLRAAATKSWALAISQITGLSHLEGKKVAVFADGSVKASPNNPAYAAITVSSGSITLDDCYAVVTVGLPYLCDIETLDIDTPQGETLVDKMKMPSRVTIQAELTRGVWIGARPPANDAIDATDGLVEEKLLAPATQSGPTPLVTGNVTVNIQSEWNTNGRIFVRQIDPLPMTITAIAPAGLFPFRGGQ